MRMAIGMLVKLSILLMVSKFILITTVMLMSVDVDADIYIDACVSAERLLKLIDMFLLPTNTPNAYGMPCLKPFNIHVTPLW